MFFFQPTDQIGLNGVWNGAFGSVEELTVDETVIKIGSVTIGDNMFRPREPNSIKLKADVAQMLYDESLDVLMLTETSFNMIKTNCGRLIKWDNTARRDVFKEHIMFSNEAQEKQAGVALLIKEQAVNEKLDFESGFRPQSGLHYVKIRLNKNKPYLGATVIGVFRQPVISKRVSSYETTLADALNDIRPLILKPKNTVIVGDLNADWRDVDTQNIFVDYLPTFTQSIMVPNFNMGADHDTKVDISNPSERPHSSTTIYSEPDTSIMTTFLDRIKVFDRCRSRYNRERLSSVSTVFPTPRTPLPQLHGICRHVVLLPITTYYWHRCKLGAKLQTHLPPAQGSRLTVIHVECIPTARCNILTLHNTPNNPRNQMVSTQSFTEEASSRFSDNESRNVTAFPSTRDGNRVEIPRLELGVGDYDYALEDVIEETEETVEDRDDQEADMQLPDSPHTPSTLPASVAKTPADVNVHKRNSEL